jgi:hypothetical protein
VNAQQLVELDLYGLRIAVLRALDQEHHEERDDGGAGVDRPLARYRSSGRAAASRPSHDDSDAEPNVAAARWRYGGGLGESREQPDDLAGVM